MNKTPKQFVQSILPNVRIEKHHDSFNNYTYYLVRNGSEQNYISEGSTPKDAWIVAKQQIMHGLYKTAWFDDILKLKNEIKNCESAAKMLNELFPDKENNNLQLARWLNELYEIKTTVI